MAQPPDAARRHYLEQKAITAGTVNAVSRWWAQIDPTDIAGSWAAEVRDHVTPFVLAGQIRAAAAADPYLEAIAAELSINAPPAASVSARAFAGVAADGRPLVSLLDSGVVATLTALGAGADVTTALRSGAAILTRIVGTQIADAGRTATATAIAARPTITAWVRMLNPPSCARCAVLAGKRYRWNTGFARHPLCDCVHIPVTEDVAGDLTTDPRAYFDSLTAADQAKYFTAAGAEAIRQGADIGQVVNARRGLYLADGRLATIEGTTKRGYAGKVLQGRRRLMPEEIIADGATRAEVIAGLRANGFLT